VEQKKTKASNKNHFDNNMDHLHPIFLRQIIVQLPKLATKDW